jgi:hypothetical protein
MPLNAMTYFISRHDTTLHYTSLQRNAAQHHSMESFFYHVHVDYYLLLFSLIVMSLYLNIFIQVEGDEWRRASTDIVIAGLGWISITGTFRALLAAICQNVPSLFLSYTVCFQM